MGELSRLIDRNTFMRKRILSFLLVLCMLLPTLPLLGVPAVAAEPTLYRYNDTAVTFQKVISETTYRQDYPVLEDATAEADQYAAYVAWLKAEGTFAINQGNGPWKLGQYDLATGQISELISRVAFFAGDKNTTTYGDGKVRGSHDTTWFVTETVYQQLGDTYLASKKGVASI